MALTVTPRDIDVAVRTVLGEAASEPALGQAAVAAVIANRAMATGRSPADIALTPSAFSAWNSSDNGGNPLPYKYNPGDPAYDRVKAIVEGVFSGAIPDPTGGATHYYAPSGMKGGKAPSWAASMDPTVTIGGHHFFYDASYGAGGQSSSSSILASGARGDSVRALQTQLAAAGFNPGAIDGVYGPQTRAAVVAFQQAAGIGVDGRAGPVTMASLQAVTPTTGTQVAQSGGTRRGVQDPSYSVTNVASAAVPTPRLRPDATALAYAPAPPVAPAVAAINAEATGRPIPASSFRSDSMVPRADPTVYPASPTITASPPAPAAAVSSSGGISKSLSALADALNGVANFDRRSVVSDSDLSKAWLGVGSPRAATLLYQDASTGTLNKAAYDRDMGRATAAALGSTFLPAAQAVVAAPAAALDALAPFGKAAANFFGGGSDLPNTTQVASSDPYVPTTRATPASAYRVSDALAPAASMTASPEASPSIRAGASSIVVQPTRTQVAVAPARQGSQDREVGPHGAVTPVAPVAPVPPAPVVTAPVARPTVRAVPASVVRAPTPVPIVAPAATAQPTMISRLAAALQATPTPQSMLGTQTPYVQPAQSVVPYASNGAGSDYTTYSNQYGDSYSTWTGSDGQTVASYTDRNGNTYGVW